MVKVLDYSLEVSEFEQQHHEFHYDIHFRANILGKGMNPLISQAIG